MGEHARTHAPLSAGRMRADTAAPALTTSAARGRRYAGCDVYGLAASVATVWAELAASSPDNVTACAHACFVRTATAGGTAAPARVRRARPAQAAAQPAPRRAGGRPVVHGRRVPGIPGLCSCPAAAGPDLRAAFVDSRF